MKKDNITEERSGEEERGFLFWQSKSYEERLTVLEEIRSTYNTKKYGQDPGFQKVARVIKKSKTMKGEICNLSED